LTGFVGGSRFQLYLPGISTARPATHVAAALFLWGLVHELQDGSTPDAGLAMSDEDKTLGGHVGRLQRMGQVGEGLIESLRKYGVDVRAVPSLSSSRRRQGHALSVS
jgi:hypothetical protein